MQIESRISSLLEYFAECSFSYAKIMQMSAMKAFFQIAECSLSYAKIQRFLENYKKIVENVLSLSFFVKVCRIESYLVVAGFRRLR